MQFPVPHYIIYDYRTIMERGKTMKRLNKMLGVLLIPVLLLSLAVPALAADVRRSEQKLTVDGLEIDCEKYNIDGSNYFKLRDLAYLLSGTASAFEVDWDAERQTVSITTGQDYMKVGGELEIGADLSSQAQASSQTIVIDGKTVEGLSVYNIGGNNYFKLRDLGVALGFAVDYNADTNTAVVKSVGSTLTGDAASYYEAGNAVFNAGDYAAAVIWYRRAAELGHAEAQSALGDCYFYGFGVEQDYATAVAWCRKAAEQGLAVAQTSLGYCYDYGLGVEQDDVAAVAWYRKAAEQGESAAQYNMGDCYYNGIGVEQDYTAAIAWWAKAALQGDANAQSSLGLCCFYGYGVEQDYLTAVEWFIKAAEQGEPYAQYYLGICCEQGLGVSVNPESAQFWYDLAAEQGVTGSDN